ncbi:MAG: glycosyl transferase family 4 [Nanoarchaeota archaeon]|nr:glycosyl transferase family 4 [Nanoarchaeota archaeon]MBU1051208.1 glycosyl transferase family 4 [Nanoarchaeota archaeon]MBU1988147.1 glycosyl transferase family 4 [Nanoarchaeota archaeon]
MKSYILIFPILASFLVTLFFVPPWIRRAKNAGLVGKDVNKFKGEKIAEAGGVTVISGFVLGVLTYVAISTFILKRTDNFVEIFALMSSILFISFIAFTDDILGWRIGLRRRTRLVLVAFASIPLIAINAGKSVVSVPFFGAVDLGIVYPLVLIPLGVVGATTTLNFLAGFNGLEAGEGIILISAFAMVSYFTGNTWLSIIALCMIASLFAFLIYNLNPAQVLGGDSLTYLVGGLVATMAILGNFEKVAVFFFIPVIIEVVLKSRGKLLKQSFGKPKKDGSLDLKYDKIYSLNHLAILLMKKYGTKPTEKKAVFLIWAFQIIIIILGFLIFKEGIFS